MRLPTFMTGIGALWVVSLCQCSLAFDLSDIAAGGDGGPGAQPALDAAAEAAGGAGPGEAGAVAPDDGGLAHGLVAFYPFDETSGTSAADVSGNGHMATLVGGAAFAPGLENNALSLKGNGQYVALPNGIVSTLTSCSISAWVNVTTVAVWSRIFDFGTGTTAYMYLTPNQGSGKMQFAITSNGYPSEQHVEATSPPTGTWQHVVLVLGGGAATLYVNGSQAAQSTAITTNAMSLGVTTHNWIGRSEYASDSYLTGSIDNLRIYSRSLTKAEVQTLYAGHL